VNIQLDAGRAQMAEAIHAFGGELARSKGAGHGVQLAWRNYLVPVDAAIERIEEVRERTVELNSLLQGMASAGNPMNVIILDACRDNPFGKRVPPERPGLSQFDAPPGSLLDYATSPGNTAIDGSGENGLYTENLLRELGVSEAKIEDVFKRIRLAVRRRSGGPQIPWESTSLEEDLCQRRARLQQERQAAEKCRADEQRLAEEDKRRQQRPAAQQPAETRKPVVAPAGANPFSKGSSRANVDYLIGDAYTFRIVDVLTQLERPPFTERVTGIDGIEVTYNGGRFTKDLLGNNMRTRNGTQVTDAQFFVTEYSLGRKWTTRYSVITAQGELRKVEIDFRVVAREPVTVPTGTFEAWKIDGRGFNMTTGAALEYQYWIAPEVVRRAVLFVRMERNRGGRYFSTDRIELMSFRQS
jgi:hypothetical protein